MREKGGGVASRDFPLYFAAQTISRFGSSFTLFGLPLLVFSLTGSAMGLAITSVTGFLPFLMFGLFAGAWVDRTNRKRVLVLASLSRGLVIAVIPVLAANDALTVWALYAVSFANTSLGVVSVAVENTVPPRLVPRNRLMAANGRLQSSYSIAQALGPLMAGVLVGGGMPVPAVFGFDAVSFVVAAACFALVRAQFNDSPENARSSLFQDVRQGLRYVLGHDLLRNIAIVAALINFFGGTISTQLVYFARNTFDASDWQIGVLFAGGSVGTATVLLFAGRITRRLSLQAATLGAMLFWSVLVLGMAISHSFWLTLIFWSAAFGMPMLFAVRTLTLRQSIVDDRMLGRVQMFGHVLAESMLPLGVLAGAWIIESTGEIAAVYAGIATVVAVVVGLFWIGPLRAPLRS